MRLLMSTTLQWGRTMSHFNEIFCNWCRRPMTPDSRVSTKVSDIHASRVRCLYGKIKAARFVDLLPLVRC